MKSSNESVRARLPSVDALLRTPRVTALIEHYGRPATTDVTRSVLATLRKRLTDAPETPNNADAIADAMEAILEARMTPGLRPVFNLTGTVLHTNLGRAPLPEAALEAIARTARGASNLEFDLKTGRRGDRDAIIEDRLCRLTGAEAATIARLMMRPHVSVE